MSWTTPSCNQKIHPPGTSTGTPLGHRRPAPALALLPRGSRSGHLPTNPVLAVKRRYASLNSSTTRRSHPHAVHCSLRSIKKELVAFSMSSKLATSVTVVADQPCRGVPPRLLTRALLLRSGCHSQPKGWPRDSKDRWPVKAFLVTTPRTTV